MARLEDANPKQQSGGYHRIFGNQAIGDLVTKIHSTSISAGHELEKIIKARVEQISDLDAFLRQNNMEEGVYLVPKAKIKQSQILEFPEAEPDFLIFKNRNGKKSCHVVELKDGHSFDTKKAAAEQNAMKKFIQENSARIPYRVQGHFCAFNQTDKNTIWEGFKKKIQLEEAMTGREFCELLEINYDEIIELRKADCDANLEYFVQELLKIPPVRQRITSLLN